jgi:hypothetical protein
MKVLMRSALFWDITQHCVVIVYRRFETMYRSHFHGSRVRVGKHIGPIFTGQESWPVKVGPIRCLETSVNNYHTTPRNIPEDRRANQHRGGSLKSKVLILGICARLARSEVLVTVTIKITVFWDVTSCWLAEIEGRLAQTYILCVLGGRPTLKTQKYLSPKRR